MLQAQHNTPIVVESPERPELYLVKKSCENKQIDDKMSIKTQLYLYYAFVTSMPFGALIWYFYGDHILHAVGL